VSPQTQADLTRSSLEAGTHGQYKALARLGCICGLLQAAVTETVLPALEPLYQIWAYLRSAGLVRGGSVGGGAAADVGGAAGRHLLARAGVRAGALADAQGPPPAHLHAGRHLLRDHRSLQAIASLLDAPLASGYHPTGLLLPDALPGSLMRPDNLGPGLSSICVSECLQNYPTHESLHLLCSQMEMSAPSQSSCTTRHTGSWRKCLLASPCSRPACLPRPAG